jgi:2-iminobutanoate/2-iminopropanoate deaminase
MMYSSGILIALVIQCVALIALTGPSVQAISPHSSFSSIGVHHPADSSPFDDIREVDNKLKFYEQQLCRIKAETERLEKKKEVLISQRGKTTRVLSPDAPKPIGPYSQAVMLNNQIYVSGCIGIDPSTGGLVHGGIEEQTVQALKNLQAILSAARSSKDRIAKTTIYVTDLAQYAVVNKLYASFLEQGEATGEDLVLPARTTVQVSALPLGALVEIDAVAGIF